MKTLKILFVLILLVTVTAFNHQDQIYIPQEEVSLTLRSVKHNAFQAGEKLEYRIHYGVIGAGTAKMEVHQLDQKIAGREVYHMVGTGKSKGAFDWFFKVRDRYETYMDVEGVFPWLFVRNVNEGGYKIHQTYKFAQNKKKVDNGKGKTFETPLGVQDMLSSFYYARTIDFSKAKKKEVFTIWSFVDDELWPLKIRYMGRYTIKVSGKKYRALKFHPVVQKGRLFENEEDVTVWVSDDGNKIPLLAEGKVLIGSVKMELTKYSGLANPIAKVE